MADKKTTAEDSAAATAHLFPARRAPKDAGPVGFTDAAGSQVEIEPKDGYYRAETPEGDAALQSLGFLTPSESAAVEEAQATADAAAEAARVAAEAPAPAETKES